MTTLIKVEEDIYIPSFNENTDEYYDLCPYTKYKRGHILYECRCKAGSSFKDTGSFNQHIKSKTHKDFVKNYKKYYKEVDEQKDLINNLKAEVEILNRKLNKALNRNNTLLKMLRDDNDDDYFNDTN